MLNFREELNRINEGSMKKCSIEEQTDFYLRGLLSTIALQNNRRLKKLVFISNGARISVKASRNHISNMFDLHIVDKQCKLIFDSIKKRFESENFRIEEHGEEGNIFIVYLD